MSMLHSRSCLPNSGLVCAVIICATSRKSEESSTHRTASSNVPAPLEIQAVRDLARARGKEMQAENLNAQVAAQVGVGLVERLVQTV